MIDFHVNGTGYASQSTLFYFLFLYFYYIINIYYLFHYFLFTIIIFILLGMDSKCFLTSTDLQTRRARCQHQLSFLFIVIFTENGTVKNNIIKLLVLICSIIEMKKTNICKLIGV